MKIAPVFILLCSLLPFTVSSQLIPRTFDQNSQNPDNDKIVTTFGELIFKGNAKKLDKRLNKRFKQIDVDGNGEMSLDEYVYSTRSFQVDFIVSTLNRTNTDADRQQFLNRQPTEQEKNVYRQMDINKDGRVQLNEYINSYTWAFNYQVVIDPKMCSNMETRVGACDMDPEERIAGDQKGITVGQYLSLASARCKSGLSSLSSYSLENCLIQSPCEKIPSCLRDHVEFGEAIVESSGNAPGEMDSIAEYKPPESPTDYDLTKRPFTPTSVIFMLADAALILALSGTFIALALTSAASLAILPFLVAVFVSTTVGSVLLSLVILLLASLGVTNFIGAFAMHFASRARDSLNVPKYFYTGHNNLTTEMQMEPKCELFTYWPSYCGPPKPFVGIATNRPGRNYTKAEEQMVEGVPFDPRRCDIGGELWSLRACKALAGGLSFNQYSAPCGLRVYCKPLCYKATLDSCDGQFKFVNSSLLLSQSIPNEQKPLKPQDLNRLEAWDRRYVKRLGECLDMCKVVGWQCAMFILQVPTKRHENMRCTLLRRSGGTNAITVSTSQSVSAISWPKSVGDVYDIVDGGDEHLAKDGKVPPFVVGWRS